MTTEAASSSSGSASRRTCMGAAITALAIVLMLASTGLPFLSAPLDQDEPVDALRGDSGAARVVLPNRSLRGGADVSHAALVNTTDPVNSAVSVEDTAGFPQAPDTGATSSGSPASGSATFAKFVYNTGVHPSCAAEAILRRHKFGTGANAGGAMDPSSETLETLSRYEKWNCFKHGGHYKPGVPRDLRLPPLPPLAERELAQAHRHLARDGTEVVLDDQLNAALVQFYSKSAQTPDVPLPAPNRVVLHNVLLLEERLYTCLVAVGGKPRTFPIAGAFSMVTGNWPQTYHAESPALYPMPARWRQALCHDGAANVSLGDVDAAVVEHSVGYYQFPTDFLSAYHVFIEVVFNAFAALHRHATQRATSWPAANKIALGRALVLTQRPSYSRYGFKPASCKHGAQVCLGTLWANLMKLVATYGLSGSHVDDAQVLSASAELGSTPTDDWIVGLRESAIERQRPPTVVRELIVGYPTQCEPLWGPDPIFVDRASRLGARQLLEDEEVLACHRLLWNYRGLLMRGAGIHAAKTDEIVDLQRHGVQVVWISREGDWARHVTNEKAVMAAIERHLDEHYDDNNSTRPSLRSVRVRGSFSEQVRAVHADTTVYITNHGANIIPSLYVRPNSGLITLDSSTPGFLPFALAPSWLHWRRLTIDRKCNPRLAKKCKLSSPNNDDSHISAVQIDLIIRAIDSIVTEQRVAPRSPPTPG